MEETSDDKLTTSPHFPLPGLNLRHIGFCGHAKSTQFCRRLRFPAAWAVPDTLNPSQPPPSLPPFFHGKVMTVIKHILDGGVLPRTVLMLPTDKLVFNLVGLMLYTEATWMWCGGSLKHCGLHT